MEVTLLTNHHAQDAVALWKDVKSDMEKEPFGIPFDDQDGPITEKPGDLSHHAQELRKISVFDGPGV